MVKSELGHGLADSGSLHQNSRPITLGPQARHGLESAKPCPLPHT
jgi:hypothetical protein